MREHVVVVPSDQIIVVDGMPLRLEYAAPATLHAIQWHNGAGHMEWLDDINHPLAPEDYAEDVAPYVALWEQETARLAAEAAAAEAARLAEYNSPEARGERVRVERDKRLAACDYLIMPDYPLAEVERAAWMAYRQALRDLPQQEGFPWEGPEDPAVSWPVEPN